MTKYVTVQPSAFTDGLTEDGTEMTRLPYPFHVTADGSILRQDFWHGDPKRVVGFAKRLDVHQVDLWWTQAWKSPQEAVGMYLVTQNADGSMHSHRTAIESMEVHDDE